MRKRSHRFQKKDVYISDVSRMSVYPSFKGKDHRKETLLREGDIIKVKVVGMDENGRGVAYYKGFQVIIDEATPGSEVVCKVYKIAGRIVYAKPLRTQL